jgi:hypothetical protein
MSDRRILDSGRSDRVPDGPWPGYECVEPALGAEIWRLDDPRSDAALRTTLELHLEICDDCRLRRATERRVAEGLRAGRLVLSDDGRDDSSREELTVGRSPVAAGTPARRPRTVVRPFRRNPWLWTLTGGSTLVAAGIALLLLLPPLPRDGAGRFRGETGPTILRPVEGEVVLDRTPRVDWQPVDGATSYEVTVDEVAGGYEWSERTVESHAEVPPTSPLPADRTFRAFVEPLPRDLAAPGGETVSFATGDFPSYLRHRWSAGSPAARVIAVFGLANVIVAGFVLLRGARFRS